MFHRKWEEKQCPIQIRFMVKVKVDVKYFGNQISYPPWNQTTTGLPGDKEGVHTFLKIPLSVCNITMKKK